MIQLLISMLCIEIFVLLLNNCRSPNFKYNSQQILVCLTFLLIVFFFISRNRPCNLCSIKILLSEKMCIPFLIGFYFLWLLVFNTEICKFYFYGILIHRNDLYNRFCIQRNQTVITICHILLIYYLLIFLLTHIHASLQEIIQGSSQKIHGTCIKIQTVGVHVG